jgi:hypothetical protein
MRQLAILGLLIVSAPLAAADVYRSVDAQGHVQYSDQPSPGAVRISVSGAHPGAPVDTPAKSATDNDAASLAKSNAQIREQQAQQAAKQAVSKDLTQSRAEQCKKLQERYQQTIDAHRLYRTGKDGEREYMTDAETDQARLDARLDMEAACGKSTP